MTELLNEQEKLMKTKGTSVKRLEGKIALITGGNSGIGLATAKQFVKEGAFVFVTGRRRQELDTAMNAIGRSVTAVQSDVSKMDDLDRLFSQIKREKGKLDILFANAGVAQYAPLGEISEDFYYSDCVRRWQQRASGKQRLFRNKSRRAFICANMDHGFKSTAHPRQRSESGHNRHTRTKQTFKHY
jgi:NAD(P)-dependent dehydrogenase (short-subunit alcohol dehydrogenase family)